jgi:hypothetical protein
VQKIFANFISYVFHPLLMATGLMAILYFFAPSVIQPISEASIKPILLMVFILTYIIPLISIGMLKLTSSISNLKLSNRRERLMPFFFITVYYGLTTYLFANKVVLGHTLLVIFASITAVIFFVTIITIVFKISAHSAGAWGMVGIMMALHFKYPDSQLFYPIIAGIVIAGVINSSRLYLGEHNLKEIGFGSLLGFIISFGTVFTLT